MKPLLKPGYVYRTPLNREGVLLYITAIIGSEYRAYMYNRNSGIIPGLPHPIPIDSYYAASIIPESAIPIELVRAVYG